VFVGNRLDSSAPTIREGGWKFHYGISAYGHVGPRNHIINNVMNDTHSFRTKFMFRGTVLQGNIMLGSCSTVPCTYPGSRPEDLWKMPEDRIVFRNNTLLGRVQTHYQPMPPCGPGGNWCDRFKAFISNFVPEEKNRAQSIEAARFADPAYLDYRLQADSPLKGKALGGGDVGAHRQPKGRVLYVSPKGDDDNSGDSGFRPFGTLAKAAGVLEPGDTLYVMPGAYAEALAIARSGSEEKPITVRAHGKQDVALPSISVAGSWVVLEGFTVTDDGITVTGDHVTVKHCVMRDCGGCGVRATGGKALTLGHCTLVGNGKGLGLERGSVDAVVRDCIFASNRDGAVIVSDDSRSGYLTSSNCYCGDKLDRDRIATELGNAVGDPKFVDPAKDDFRLQWDSPAAHLAPFGRPAGAKAALICVPEITGIKVAGVTADSAVVTWLTPRDDTAGKVHWRAKGEPRWKYVEHRALGTVHGAGLLGLKPLCECEFKIAASSRRAGAATSAIRTFKTSDKPHVPTTYRLSPAGDDSADGRSEQTAWRTIRRACFAVAPGDTVRVAPGVYHHAISPLRGGVSDRRITFRKHGDGEAVIDSREVSVPLVKLIGKHYITVDGFIFANLPRNGHPGVVKVDSSDGFELLNCRIGHKKRHAGFGNGVNLYRCSNARIERNVIWGTRYHCVLNQCTNALIKNNTFTWGQVFSTHFLGKHDGCRFVNNIFYYPTSVPNAALAIAFPSRDIKLTSDYNLFGPMRDGTHVAYVYAGAVTNLAISGPTLKKWQKNSGQDLDSIQAEPMFINPRVGNFRLKSESPGVGAGQGGANMGACGVEKLSIHGRKSLLPGEGRTIRMEARLTGPASGKTVFQWNLPGGEKRQGAVLEYTPPADVSRFELKLTATDPKGDVATAREYISVCPAELARLDGPVARVEAEDFTAQGGGEVRFYKLINASGKAVTHWYGNVGHWLEWEFETPSDGEYVIHARYATRLRDRSRSLTLDGASPGAAYEKISFPCTGGWSISEDNWAFKKLGPPIRLKSGKHRLRMTNLNSAVNVDYLVICDLEN